MFPAKKEPNPPHWGRSWSSRAAWSAVFRENSKWWTKIHTRLTQVSRVKKVIQQFYWLNSFFGFYWWLSYLVKLITSQNCTIMLRNLTFVVQFSYFSIRPKKVFFFARNCWATFVTTFDFFLATFWEIPGNVWKNLEQLVESPSHKVHWMVL